VFVTTSSSGGAFGYPALSHLHALSVSAKASGTSCASAPTPQALPVLLGCSKIAEAEAVVSVNEKKWLVMHVLLGCSLLAWSSQHGMFALILEGLSWPVGHSIDKHTHRYCRPCVTCD
jgi:hypothetical protein